MRILMVGATGVLGRSLAPHLQGHALWGTTRREERMAGLRELGVTPLRCDVYVAGDLERAAREAAPEVVVNLLTDLAAGLGPGNARIRREGGPLVADVARRVGARRLVVESIAFPAGPDGDAAVRLLEEGALASGLEAVVLRFGRIWGPGTFWPARQPEAPAVRVENVGRLAAPLLLGAAPGTYQVADPA